MGKEIRGLNPEVEMKAASIVRGPIACRNYGSHSSGDLACVQVHKVTTFLGRVHRTAS